MNLGGGVLQNPKIVTVTYDSDPNAATYESFGDRIGQTNYWRTALSEYGVGTASSGSNHHVRITTPPPATITDVALEAMIADRVTNSDTSGWTAWDPQNIYIIYVPEQTKLLDATKGTDACADYNGFHSEVTAGMNQVIYAVVDQSCHDQPNNTPDKETVNDYATWVASHELGEAATDPHTQTNLALSGFDPAHQAWELFQTRQNENGDACENFDDSFYHETESSFTFKLQRMWTNASASAGHNPCVPLDGKPYFNVTPLNLDNVDLLVGDGNGTKGTTGGVHVTAGQTKTVSLGFLSDADTGGAWTIAAAEGDGMSTLKTKHLDVSIDKTTGQNGEKAVLTIHTKSVGPKHGTLLTVVSTQDGVSPKYLPILVQTN